MGAGGALDLLSQRAGCGCEVGAARPAIRRHYGEPIGHMRGLELGEFWGQVVGPRKRARPAPLRTDAPAGPPRPHPHTADTHRSGAGPPFWVEARVFRCARRRRGGALRLGEAAGAEPARGDVTNCPSRTICHSAVASKGLSCPLEASGAPGQDRPICCGRPQDAAPPTPHAPESTLGGLIRGDQWRCAR